MLKKKGLLDLSKDNRSKLESKFVIFKQNIELTENQKIKISNSYRALGTELKKLEYVKKTFLTGSYSKSTMIRPPNDIDIFVVLTKSQEKLEPQSVLNKLKKDIESIPMYSKSTIRQDSPCVVVDLNYCKFELTPALENFSLLGGYKIPKKYNQELIWKQIEDPNNLASRLTDKNAKLDKKLVPLIKMMKYCKRKNNIDNIKSFEMEEKAIDGLDSVPTYRDGVQKLLKIYDWSDPNIKNYHHFLESLDDIEFAKRCRNDIFGTEFPE